MPSRLILLLSVICVGSASALVDVGPAVGFDSRPPGEGDPVYGLSLAVHVGPASVYARGAIMPADSGDASSDTYVDEWERRYYSADVAPLVAISSKETALIVGVGCRQSRFEDYDYEGGEKQTVPFPFTYADGETTSRRILALGGVKFANDEGLSGAAWGGVGVALNERTGTAWVKTGPSEPAISWSLDAEWKTLELAAAAFATYKVAKCFGITGGFEITNRIKTLDGDAPGERPVGFALFFAPVLQL